MSVENAPGYWDSEITSDHGFLNLNLKEVWAYRDLLWLLIRRDFVSFYKQTLFGPLWFFIQPVFTTIIFTFIFSNLAKISTNDAPPPLFYMAGTIAWSYFSDCLTKTSTVFKDNAHLFGKVYFPRLIIPLSIVFSNLTRFGVQLTLFAALLGYYLLTGHKVHPNSLLALFPLVLLLMALQGLGIGLIVTALTTKYRDLAFVVGFGMQLLMYATPVIYPLSAAPLKYRTLIMLNPMSGLIETFRFGFLGTGSFYPAILGYSAMVSLGLFVVGLLAFNRTEKNFVDTI